MMELENELAQELEKYQGGKAMLWDYSLGHHKLLIKLEKIEVDLPLFLVVTACTHYSGAFTWSDIDLKLESNFSVESDEKLWFQKLIDLNNDIEIISKGGITIVKHDTTEDVCFT